jgi:hypothetical protein
MEEYRYWVCSEKKWLSHVNGESHSKWYESREQCESDLKDECGRIDDSDDVFVVDSGIESRVTRDPSSP